MQSCLFDLATSSIRQYRRLCTLGEQHFAPLRIKAEDENILNFQIQHFLS